MNSLNSIRHIPEKPKLVRQTNLDDINMNLHTNDSNNLQVDILKYLDYYCSEILCSPSNTLCSPSNTLCSPSNTLSDKNIKK